MMFVFCMDPLKISLLSSLFAHNTLKAPSLLDRSSYLAIPKAMMSITPLRVYPRERTRGGKWDEGIEGLGRAVIGTGTRTRTRTYRLIPVFRGFRAESTQSLNPYFTHRSHGLMGQHLIRGHRTTERHRHPTTTNTDTVHGLSTIIAVRHEYDDGNGSGKSYDPGTPILW